MNPARYWKSYLKFKYRNIGDASNVMPLYKTAIISLFQSCLETNSTEIETFKQKIMKNAILTIIQKSR